MQDSSHTSPAAAARRAKRPRRLRRLALSLLLIVLLPVLLAGGGLAWLCSASGQDWLRTALNEALTPALAEQGLRLRIERLEGLPFAVRLSLRGEDEAGLWLDVPDARLDWKPGWEHGPVLRVERLGLYGGGLYRLPIMPESPPETGPALTPGALADDIALSVGNVLTLLGGLPDFLPRLDGRLVLDRLTLPPQWLVMLPQEEAAGEAPPEGVAPLPVAALPRVSLELQLAGALGSRADVRAQADARAFWPQAPDVPPNPASVGAEADEAAAGTADGADHAAHTAPDAPSVAAPVTAPAAPSHALPDALLPLFGGGEARVRLNLQARREPEVWRLNLPELSVSAGMAQLSGRLGLTLEHDAARWWGNPLDLALDAQVTPAPHAPSWAGLLSGPTTAALRLSGPLGAPVLSLQADGAGLLPPDGERTPPDASAAAPGTAPDEAALREPRLRLEARPLRWRSALDGGTTRAALHAESRYADLPLRAGLLLAAGLRHEGGERFWRLSLEDIFATGAGSRLAGSWGLDLALTESAPPQALPPAPAPAASALPATPLPAADAHEADDIISRRIAAVLHLLPPMRGRVDLAVTDWRQLGKLGALAVPGLSGEGQPARFALRATGREAPEAVERLWGDTDWHLALTAPQGRLRRGNAPLLDWRNVRLQSDLAPQAAPALAGEAATASGVPALSLDLQADSLDAGLRLVRPRVRLHGPLSGPLKLEGTTEGDLRAGLALLWQPGLLRLERLTAALPAHNVGLTLQQGSSLRYRAAELQCAPLHIRFTPSGELRLEGNLTPKSLQARLQLAKTALEPWQAVLPGLPQGFVALEARLQGTPERPQGTFSLDVTGLHVPHTPLPPLNMGLSGGVRQAGNGGEAFLALNLPAESRRLLGADAVEGRFSLPLTFADGLPRPAPRGALKGSLRWQGAAAPLWNLVPLADRRLSGRLELRADLSGSLEAPALTANVALSEGRFEDVALGVLLKDLQMRAALDRSTLSGLKGLGRIRLDASCGDGHQGRANLEGELSPGGNLRLAGRLDKLRPLRRRDVSIQLSGTASASGPLTAPAVRAAIDIDAGEVRIDRLSGTSSITTLPITADDAPQAAPRQRPAVGSLDARVRTTGRFVVRGRGLESLWRADIRANGPLTNPRVLGAVEAVEGSFNFLNAKFNLYRGVVRFAGGSPSNPLLDVVLRHEAADIVADVRLGGTAQQPKFQLTSTPAMPQEEIISRVMFGRASNDLGRFENLRLAAAVAELAGFGGGGLSVLDVARKTLGVDVLRISSRPGSSDSNDEDAESTLEAGKFIGEKLYLGVAQGLKPDSTAVVIELQLTPHSKAQVRTEQNNTSAGVRWKINY